MTTSLTLWKTAKTLPKMISLVRAWFFQSFTSNFWIQTFSGFPSRTSHQSVQNQSPAASHSSPAFLVSGFVAAVCAKSVWYRTVVCGPPGSGKRLWIGRVFELRNDAFCFEIVEIILKTQFLGRAWHFSLGTNYYKQVVDIECKLTAWVALFPKIFRLFL